MGIEYTFPHLWEKLWKSLRKSRGRRLENQRKAYKYKVLSAFERYPKSACVEKSVESVDNLTVLLRCIEGKNRVILNIVFHRIGKIRYLRYQQL